MKFDMSRAWNTAMELTRDNWHLLVVLSGIFVFLPGAVFTLSMASQMEQAMQPGADPERLRAAFLEMWPRLLLVYVGLLLAQLVGYVSMIALLSDGRRPTVGHAVLHALKVIPTLIAVTLIALIVYFGGLLIAGILGGAVIAGLSMISSALGVLAGVILSVAFIIAGLYIITRFSLTAAVIAIERISNPFRAFGRSWRLSRPTVWPLVGFYVLLFIAYAVIAIVVYLFAGGLFGAMLGPNAFMATSFVLGALGAIAAMIFAGVLAAVYRQLAGPAPEAVSETFE